MKIADKYILKQYLGPFILTFFIALFVLIMQWLWLYIDDLVGKGIEWYYIAELFIYASAHFVPMALPLAVLLSGLMTMGNLGENYELVAFKAAGISLMQVLRPLMAFAFLLSIFAFLFSNYILPVANLKMNTLFYDIREQKPAVDIKPGVFYNQIEGYVIKVNKKEKKQGKEILKEIMIYDHTQKQGNTTVVIADSGEMFITPDKMYAIMTLYHGCAYHEDFNPRDEDGLLPFYKRCFDENKIYFDLSEFKLNRSDEEIFKDHYQMMNLQQLQNEIDTFYLQKQKQIEDYHNQFIHLFTPPVVESENQRRKTKDTLQLALDTFLSKLTPREKLILFNALTGQIRAAENRAMVLGEIQAMTDQNIRNYTIEIHRKFTLSAACIILFFIGAPLGSIIRKGGLGVPLVVSVILFIFYHIISISGEKMAKEGVIDPALGMWLPIAVYLPLGIFFTIKATTDSSLFVIEQYILFFKNNRIFKWINKLLKTKPRLSS